MTLLALAPPGWWPRQHWSASSTTTAKHPQFVLIGGLVPELLCSGSPRRHAGTTDIDVQVDLEIAAGAVNTKRLEAALGNAEFEPDSERVWRWKANGAGTVVKFKLLADIDTEPAVHATARIPHS